MTAPSTVAAAMQHAIDLLRELTPAQLEDLALGRARLELRDVDGAPVPPEHAAAPSPRHTPHAAARRPRTPKVAVPRSVTADVSAAVEAISRLTTPAEVSDYLQAHDRRFTTPVLREIARALGPTVSAAVRSKAELRRNIVEGTAGFRTRSAAMSGGAWS